MQRRGFVIGSLATLAIAGGAACAPATNIGTPALVRSCRSLAADPANVLGTSPGGNATGVRLMANGAAWLTIYSNDPSPCNAQGGTPSDRIDVLVPMSRYGGSVAAATAECNDAGGVPQGPVGDDDTELACRGVDF